MSKVVEEMAYRDLLDCGHAIMYTDAIDPGRRNEGDE